MAHPKDRSGITRSQLLRSMAGAAVLAAGGGVLAGCENTTTAIGACETGGGAGSKLVEPKPLGPLGLPLPRTDNSVTWALLDQNKAIRSGLAGEGGTLRLYNYADYINPATLKKFEKAFNCKVQVATYNSADEAYAKLSAGSAHFDVVLGLSGSHIVLLQARQLLQPLNHEYLPNLAKNIWPALQNPFYDLGARYTVPYVVWSDGIGWRNDKISTDISKMPDPVGHLLGVPEAEGQGRPARRLPRRAEHADAARRHQGGSRAGSEHGGSGDHRRRPARISHSSRPSSTSRSRSPTTRHCRRPRPGCTTRGRVICWAAPSTTCRRTSRRTCCRSGRPRRTASSRTTSSSSRRNADKPALAHHFLNFMLDEKNAYDNFIEFVGYTPPQNSIDADTLIKRKLIPESLRGALVRPDQFSANQELLALTTTGDRLWENAWSKFKAG